jgi:hypothetical protein
MKILTKITNHKSNTLLGKAMKNFNSEIGPISFILYMLPLLTLVIVYESNNHGSSTPLMYSLLISWYFLSLLFLNKIRKTGNIKSEIIEMVVCFPIYLSVTITFLLFKLFINKKKYPNVTEDKLPVYQRKFKLKKIKRKMKNNVFG